MDKQEAIKILKEFHDTSALFSVRTALETVFPELKEDEDERIRKALLNEFIHLQSKGYKFAGLEGEDIIAWLEKQGTKELDPRYENLEELLAADDIYQMSMNDAMVNEAKEKAAKALSELSIGKLLGFEKQGEQKETICEQKPINDIQKPTDVKFHEGDFIRHNKANLICKVISANSASYYVENIETSGGIELFNAEQNFHLWTIEDAKDGDVLAAQECYVIFKEIDGLNIKCHCTYHYMGFNPSFHINTLQNKTAFQPATKEQRDILFAKMKENGYEWDADKKELKKVGQEPSLDEEDIRNIENIDAVLFYDKDLPEDTCMRLRNWLKSLKQRIKGE